MLKSKFAKSNKSFKASKIFTDREEPRTVFKNSVLAFHEKPLEVITYYGKGGIGKSGLLKKLYLESDNVYMGLKDVKEVNTIFVSLDAYEFANPMNILMTICNGLKGDPGLFEYALVQYYAKAKISPEEIVSKANNLSDNVMGIINEAISIGTASASIPTALVGKCISFIKDKRIQVKYKDEIAEIATLNEFEIFERLPYYLGICITNADDKGIKHVIFLDSYESLLARTIAATPSTTNEEWLKELFASSSSLRLIIATRDKLRWDREDEDWAPYLNQHFLENLSTEDCQWFLSQVPIEDEEIIDVITEKSGGVPLFLDMCVDMYEDDKNNGESFDLDSLKQGEKIIDRYIRHLSQKEKLAIKVLSMPRSFDKRFALDLLKKQNVVYNSEELENLFERSIILVIDERRGLMKVDESVRLHLLGQMSAAQKEEGINAILACIGEGQEGASFTYLASTLDEVLVNPGYLNNKTLLENVIQEIDYYANAGYWNELYQMLKAYVGHENRHLSAIAVYMSMVFDRRGGQLSKAYQLSEDYEVTKEDLGIWYYMYRYLIIQIRHLQGHIPESMKAYRSLLDEMDLIQGTVPHQIYDQVALKYADLLFVQGGFEESLVLVNEMLEKESNSLAHTIELLRIKGHIYRFQEMYDKGALIYERGIELMRDYELHSYAGKLYTNMAEVLCMTKPEEALKWYEKSKESNEATGNKIELGKAEAAASKAYTTMGLYEEGESMAHKAYETQGYTGYRSGQAYAMVALRYNALQRGDEQKAEEYYHALKAILEEIQAYPYLLK